EMSHGAFDAIWDKRFVQISHDPKVRNTRFGWLQSPGRLGSILRALRLPRIPSASRASNSSTTRLNTEDKPGSSAIPRTGLNISSSANDSALGCLVMLLRFHGVGA